MIITLSLNPAVDKTIEIRDFKVDGVNRVTSARLDAGGKGINVSRMISRLGGQSKAIGVLAGASGSFIKQQLASLGIENDFLFVEGETRTNIKIVDPVNGLNTDINENGPDIGVQDLEEIFNRTIGTSESGSILVLAGSVPGNVSKTIYKQLIAAAANKGIKTILDADGELFRLGIEAGPYMIKPNIHELSIHFKQEIASKEEAIALAKGLFVYGIKVIVISLGSDGAILMTEDTTIMAEGLSVEVISTVGAGDAMVAAFAYSLERGDALEEALRLAVAASAASVMTPGTSPGELAVIEDLKKKVTLKYIK